MRSFDPRAQFEAIKKSATDAVREIFPVEGKLRAIRLDGVTVDDTLDATDYRGQATAKAKEQTWGVPVYAALSLVDKASGKVLDSAPRIRLFTLPKITDRLSYIVQGSEYQVANQLRLRSGAYTLRKQNGELKTQINLAKGKNFDLAFDEKTGLFTISKIGGGQANIPLAPVLAHLGIGAPAMARAWGDGLQQANRSTDPRAVTRAETAFRAKPGELKAYLDQTEISPETTKITLGTSYNKVDGGLLLAASRRLLEVHQGKAAPTDRDSLEFKELHSIEDYLHERIQKNKKALAFRLGRGVDNLRRTKLTQIVNPGAFNSVVEGFFTQDDKSSTPEQTNPLEMLNGSYRATIMGAGGITSDHMLTPEMREIHPSHYGFLDPVNTPESRLVGASLHLPLGVTKDGKDMRMVVTTPKGAAAHITPTEAYHAYVAFPGQEGQATVRAQYQGQVVEVPRSKVQYYTPSPRALFSWSTNLVPYLPSNQGNRAMMASKMLEQAIALKHREAPLVQVSQGSKSQPDLSVERAIGGTLTARAPADGTVRKVDPDFIIIKTADGDQRVNLYNNFTLNRKSFLHHYAKVKVGDRVTKGQTLAESNFSRDGTLALGTNMRVAYIPYKGLTHEDGIVITESAAERLTSEHIHKMAAELGAGTTLGLTSFRSFYPNALSPENVRKLDTDGVIQVGQKVSQGDTLVAMLQKRPPNPTVALASRALSDRPKNASLAWTLDNDGTVIDVQKTPGRITVAVKTEERAKIGDKLTGRYGNKGIVTHILPDNEAPHTADGKPVDVMLNPHGVISRINIGQIYESAAGKVATKRGKPVAVSNFSGEDYLESTKKLLAGAGISDKEELFDPVTKKSLGQVHVGNPYILKLSKQGSVNFSVRQGGPGVGYDANLQPLKAGGEEGAKSMDLLTVYSMLAHGARANLREMSSIKSNQNDEFWKALKSGQQLPAPKTPFVYEKFLGFLRGAGIDVRKNGSTMTLAPLTDAQVLKQSAGEIKKPIFYSGKDLEPKRGGFYDPVLTGGFKGTKWNHIELAEPVVNPVFTDAVKKLTGLKKEKYEGLTGGTLHFDPGTGELNAEGRGLTGGHALQHILSRIDLDKAAESVTKQIELAKKAAKDPAARNDRLDGLNKRLRYITALKTAGLRPEDAYIRKHLPILPPVFRPIYPLPDGSMASSDINYLYQNTGVINMLMKQPVMELLPDTEKADARSALAEHVAGVAGLTDLNIKGRPRKGMISEIKGGAGGQPKEGFFISKMLSKKQDFVGRGTIIPDLDLGVDEMGMPEEMAWKLFEPFVTRELARFSKTPLQAKDEITKRTPLARRALDIVMTQRHVLLNRAPSLHKFAIMAFKPKITEGRALKIPSLVSKGYNCDFDGDTMSLHMPVTDDANREAEKMLPSRNLFKPGTGALMIQPSQEAQIGLYYLSKTEAGRKELSAITGPKYPVTQVLDKKTASAMLTKMAKELPASEYAKVATDLKRAGENHAYAMGFTLGVDDLVGIKKDRDVIVKAAQRVAGKAKGDALDREAAAAGKMLDAALEKRLAGTSNPLYDMVHSGARGDKTQLRSILATPLFVTDARGRTVASPIKRSYAEGLDIGDYWVSMYGARRGAMDRSIQSSLPGAFSKDIMASVVDNVVTAEDCGTRDGIMLPVDSPDSLDRFTAGDQDGVPHNTLVTHPVVSGLKARGAKTIKVRSPLTCHRPKGTCAKCHGLDEHGHLPQVGDNLGAKAGQTIAEPLIQMTMNARHTGGVAGAGAAVGGFKRIDQILKMPDVVHGAATLALATGTVTRIDKGVGGGHDIYIGDKKMYVAAGLPLTVKKGQKVSRGDALSGGIYKPQDLVALRGMRPAQDYLVDQLHATYKAQGVPIQRRVFETVVRSLGNTTQVLNSPKDAGFIPGDVAPYTVVQSYNRNLEEMKPVHDAAGYALATPQGGMPEGHVLTDADIRLLEARGLKEVKIRKEAIQHAPFLRGLTTLPLMRQDWLSSLGYRGLAKALTQGASMGHKTDLSGENPIPALAAGVNFGKGKEGRY